MHAGRMLWEDEGRDPLLRNAKDCQKAIRSEERGMEQIPASEGSSPSDTWISGFPPSEL